LRRADFVVLHAQYCTAAYEQDDINITALHRRNIADPRKIAFVHNLE